MTNKIEQAYNIAKNYDVSTKRDCAVVYSVSFMPTERNKVLAKEFVITHQGAQMLDDTPCGKALINLGLDGKVNEVGKEITKIWRLASSRYIAAASGNLTAFVEGADERSTFCTTEMSEIMNNPKITHINKVAKDVFINQFRAERYSN